MTGRAGRVFLAVVAAAAACGHVSACALYSLDGLTDGDAGSGAGWPAGDAAGSDVAVDAPDAASPVDAGGSADSTHDVGLPDAIDPAGDDGPALSGMDADSGADAAEDAPRDAPRDAPAPYRIVFVTPQVASGSIGSAGAGDTICQSRATQDGLPGTYLAWLSDSSESPAMRMTQATVPYVLADRTTIVAAGWAGLVSGQLAHAIDETAQGSPVSTSAAQSCNGTAGYYVWTGTTTAGAPWNGYDCNAWSSASAGNVGGVGDALAHDGGWTQWCQVDCNVVAALYCVQQ